MSQEFTHSLPQRAADVRIAIARLDQDLQRAVQINECIRRTAHQPDSVRVRALTSIGLSILEAQNLLAGDNHHEAGVPKWKTKLDEVNRRRLQRRLAELETWLTHGAKEVTGALGSVLDDPSEQIVTVMFPIRPADDVRSRLSTGGFTWKPRERVWRAKRSAQTLAIAYAAAECVESTR